MINRKFWSLIFGAVIAWSFYAFISLGELAPVPQMLHEHPEFILDYYPSLVTSLATLMMTLLVVLIMTKGFQLCTSEHTFWLLLPSFGFIALALLGAQTMLIQIIAGAVPAMLVIFLSALSRRLKSTAFAA